MMKPRKRAVALVIKNDVGEFLIVKRPDSEEGPLAGAWGFPAITLEENESEIEAANRVGPTKLGIGVEIGEKIGERTTERETFILDLSDYEARIPGGQMPCVPQSDTTVTQYVGLKYTSDPKDLFPAAQRGSLCSQVYLSSIGVDWSDDEAQ